MMRKLHQLLNDNSALSKVFARAKQTERLNTILKAILKPKLRENCSLAKIENDEMIIVVNNATWATKLHYAIPDLLKELRIQPEFKNITKIRYTIAKSNPKDNPCTKNIPKPNLSQSTIDLLQNTAKNIKNKSLQKSLLRLAELGNI